MELTKTAQTTETFVNCFRPKGYIFFLRKSAVLSFPFYDFRSINYNNNSVRVQQHYR